ncbi:MAG: GDSL-type esterase/lipase family protein [Phycisphaerae bacterium]
MAVSLFLFSAALLASIAFVDTVAIGQTSQPTSRPRRADGPQRWESAIAEFEKWDSKNTPPRDAILFVGSSSIVGWRSAADFPELSIINRGFGGSQIEDSTHFADRIIAPYKPRAIVFYAGDNDVAAGESAEKVLADFDDFVARVRSTAPRTPIVFLSIKPSRSRWQLWPIAKAANLAIAARCAADRDGLLRYVDVASVLLDEKSGEPRDELFLGDKLHLSKAGYAKWNEVLRPVLHEVLKTPTSAPMKP